MTWSAWNVTWVFLEEADRDVVILGGSGLWCGHSWEKWTVAWPSLEEADREVVIPGGS